MIVFRDMSDKASTPAVDRERSRHLVPTVICTIFCACDTAIPVMNSFTVDNVDKRWGDPTPLTFVDNSRKIPWESAKC